MPFTVLQCVNKDIIINIVVVVKSVRKTVFIMVIRIEQYLHGK